MKSPRLIWIPLLALALLGAMIGYLISTERHFSPEMAPEEVANEPSTSGPQVFDLPTKLNEQPAKESLTYPNNAIEGELVVQFNNRSDYHAYLKALANAGLAPMGQIDELLAVRIPEAALLLTNLGQYGARTSYSYRVERPAPPVEFAPETLAGLTAYGASARSITGRDFGGTGEGVLVGILDSGIQAHPQFDHVHIVHLDLAGDGVAGSGAAHGTSVASIITGSEGIAPETELFVVRVLDERGMGNSYHVAEGIVQAVDLGAKIINLSLGVYQDSSLLRQAVAYAETRGVLLVAAAGNDGYNRMPYPAAYPEVLAVTAVDGSGQQARFPNQSKEIDFAAPGVGIITAKEDAGTELFTGTSAAAPFVSGTLAALISGDDALPPREAVALLRRLLNEQGAPGADPLYGSGVVDWDRLREHATIGLLDVALADIHLQPDALPGTTMPIEVTVQNRGTRWLSDSQLEVFIGESEPVHFTLGSLGPGQTTTRKVFAAIPSLNSGETLSLAARVLPDKMTDDVRPENNVKAVTFRPTP